ncbi:MAG: type I-MYXAN CRISPR-associated protein Cmx8 [Candidatus Hydrogenedentes bacterium]|nr:type I-MYXAN CRISPR-associated protein Cmx8 [Candidatus Hydrogenedentota bacterium]
MNKENKPTKGPPVKKKAKQETPKEIILEYSLYDLPSAQHKAGLVGLLFLIESMKRRQIQNIPQVIELASTSVKLCVNLTSLQALFDDYYDAQIIEVSSRSKWQGQEPIREEEIELEESEGKKKKERRFIYQAVQPKAAFLTVFNNNDNGPWLKLYRDMLWNTLRARPTTRGIYKARAEGIPANEAEKTWVLLQKSWQGKNTDNISVSALSSSLFIGAQDVNAEQVPFQGTVEQNFLLHFWSVVSRIFSPFIVNIKGESNDAGYVLVIPEPSDLRNFLEDYIDVLGSLDCTVLGYRPKAARIDVPAEGGLEYIGDMARQRVGRGRQGYSLAAVEVFHLEKQGNNVRLHNQRRIQPSLRALEQYETIKQSCRNPLFKGIRLANLLEGQSWHNGFDSLMTLWPQKFFVYKQGETPAHLPFFGRDARRVFNLLRENIKQQGEKSMDKESKENVLALRVYDLVRNYVNRRTEEKCGKDYESFKANRDERGNIIVPQDYREAREKVCTDAFLAIRGRNGTDFVEYFAGTICSVPQYLNREDFISVTEALFEDWEKVKTLSMLALSAASWTSKSSEINNDNQ